MMTPLARNSSSGSVVSRRTDRLLLLTEQPAVPLDTETMNDADNAGHIQNGAPTEQGGHGDAVPPPRRRSSRPDQHLDTEALSVLLDDALSGPDWELAAAHLEGCDACRRDLAELRATVSLLSGLPQYRPRRSFELGPEHASEVQPSRFARFLPWVPALRAASLAVALLLVVVTAIDLRSSDDATTVVNQGLPGPTATAEPGINRTEPPGVAGEQTAQDDSRSDSEANSGTNVESDQALEAAPAAAPTGPNPDPAAETSLEAPADVAPEAPVAEQAPWPEDNRPSPWRLAEVGLALILLWLLVSLVWLERLRRTAGRREPA